MKIFKIVSISLITALICLESIFRITGFVAYKKIETLNEIKPEDAHKIRILTLGSSTTADVMSENGMSAWPRQLEKMLNADGEKFRVYNVARPSLLIADILYDLPDNIETYKPHVVAFLIGSLEDDRIYFLPKSEKWFFKSKVLKFIYLTAWNLKMTWFAPKEVPSKDFDQVPGVAEILEKLKTHPLSSVQSDLDKMTSQFSITEKAQFYAFLANKGPNLQFHSNNFMNSFLLRKKSFENGIYVWDNMMLFVGLADRVGRQKDCVEAAGSYLEKGFALKPFFYSELQRCVSKLPSPDLEVLKKVVLNSRQFYDVKIGQQQDPVKIGFKNLISSLDKEGLLYIAVSPPNEDDNAMKRIVLPLVENSKNFAFASNFENFRNGLKKGKWQDYFIDRVNITGGHTTTLGHKLIAESVSQAVQILLEKNPTVP